MSRFVLTAQLQLQAPSNVRQVVNQIQSQLAGVNLPVNIQNSNSAIRQINQLQAATNNATTAAERMGAAFGVSLKRFASFSIATRAVGLFTNGLAGAIKDAIAFERQLIKVAQVSNQSISSLKGLTSTITELATSLGVESKSLLEVSTILKQAGLSANDTSIALRTLAKAALAPNFDSITETTEGAIAILAQFGLGVQALEGQLSSIDAVAGAFAVEAADLIDVIRRTGGVFKSSGGDLNELIALFTSVRATTRESAESIGTGLRTIFTRIQRPKTIEFLKQFGVELVDLEGKFVGPFEAVKRLSAALAGLGEGDLTFIRVAEELGGFRQIGKVLPLLQQFALAQEALNVAQNAGNGLTQNAVTAQQALAIRITKVKEEFLAFVRGVTESRGFQLFVNTALNLASAFIKIGEALTPVIPLLTAMMAINISRGIGSFLTSIPRGLSSNRFSGGGRVLGFEKGGIVPGVGNKDTVPAMLTPGEVVINRSAVQKYGAGNLVRMNKYAYGGKVSDLASIYPTISKAENYQDYKNKNIKDNSKFIQVVPSIEERIAFREKYKGKAYEKFENFVADKYNLGDPVAGFQFLDYPNKRAEAKFLPFGSTYKDGDGRGNNKKTAAAKNFLFENSLLNLPGNRLNISAKTFGTSAIASKPITVYWGDPSDFFKSISRTSLAKERFPSGAYSVGGLVQRFEEGGIASAKAIKSTRSKISPKQIFGTGDFPFPKRISNAYFKEIDKKLESEKFKSFDIYPKDERINIDEKDVNHSFTSSEFDRTAFMASFKDKISRNSILSSLSNFAKFIGLPQENLSTVLPRHIDFGKVGIFGADASFDRTGVGSRGLENIDLSPHGFTEKDNQDIYGYDKILEEKKKQLNKVLKTPVKTFDDGSFSYDSAAAQALWSEIDDIKKKRFEVSTKQSQAQKKANQYVKNNAEQSGRGAIGFYTAGFNNVHRNDTLYHELTHQLINGLRVKSKDSFDQYSKRVTSLFDTDNNSLAEAFDAIPGHNYKSADVVYGRSYKIAQLQDELMNRSSRRAKKMSDSDSNYEFDQETYSDIAQLHSKGNIAVTAKQFKPINPEINQTLLNNHISQKVIDRMEDSGKEEFLTTLVQNLPVLDQNLTSILDSTITDLLGSAGINRQRYVEGGKVTRKIGIIDTDVLRNKANAARVADGMKLLGVESEANYGIELSKLAGKTRQSGSLSKFTVMAGSAANRKSSVATGRGANDDATLRKTIRKHILHPDDLQDVDEVMSLTTTLKESKLDYMGMADRIYVKDSSTEDEQKLVKLFERQRNLQKDPTLYGRETGTTEGLNPDYGLQTASLISQFGTTEDRTNKGKVMTLGEKTDQTGAPRFQVRRKRLEELPELISAKGQFPGAASPLTRGHAESAIGTLLEKVREKYPDATHKDLLFALAPDLSLDGGSQGREHGARYGEYPATFRRDLIKLALPEMMISSANSPSETGINSRIAEIEKGITGRRRFAVMEQDAPVVISKAPHENPEGIMERYKSAGLTPYNIARSSDAEGDSISGTAVRQAVIDKDYDKLDLAVLPQVGSALKANQPQLRNRRMMVPLVQQALDIFTKANTSKVNEQVDSILQNASGGPFTRMTPKFKEAHPNLVKQIQQLRKSRDIFERNTFLDPAHELIRTISDRYPDIYGLDVARKEPVDVSVTEDMIKQHIVDSSKLSSYFKPGLSFNGDGIQLSPTLQKVKDTVDKEVKSEVAVEPTVDKEIVAPNSRSEIFKVLSREEAAQAAKVDTFKVYDIMGLRRELTTEEQRVKDAVKEAYVQKVKNKDRAAKATTTKLRGKGLEFGAAGLFGKAFAAKNIKIESDRLSSSRMVRVISGVMDQATATRLSTTMSQGVSDIISQGTSIVKSGSKPTAVAASPVQNLNTNTNATIQGGLIEQIIQQLGGPGAVKGKGFDFPDGLQGAAKYFNIDPNVPTDVKRTLSGPLTIKDNIVTYLKNVMGYKLGGQVYDLQKGTGLSNGEFDEIVKYSNTNNFSMDEFKTYLAKRLQDKKNKSGLMMNPASLLNAITPENPRASQSQLDLARSLMGSPDAKYNPKYDNVLRKASGGLAEAVPAKDYGKIGLRSDGSTINATYFKNDKREGYVSAYKMRDYLYYVGLSKATQGYGPRLYDTVMEEATAKGAMLTSDRSSISGAAKKVWEYYFKNRSDVKKTPLKPDDWTRNQAEIDPKLYGKPETWPPPTDPAWILQSGYSKSPSLINTKDVIRMDGKVDSRSMALQYFQKRAIGGAIDRQSSGIQLPSGRGKAESRGARDIIEPISSDTYIKWARKIYEEYDNDPSLVTTKDELGIRMPPEIALANRLLSQYAFETGGAGLSIGRKFVVTPPEYIDNNLRPYLIPNPNNPEELGFYEDVVAKFGRAKAPSQSQSRKLGKEQSLKNIENRLNAYTLAESSISEFKKTGSLNLSGPIKDYLIRSIRNPDSLPLEKGDLAVLKKKLSPTNIKAFEELIGNPPKIVDIQGQRTKLSEIFNTILETYGSDVSSLEVDNITRAMGQKLYSGGMLQRYNSGGSVPALVSNGEAYVPPKVAKRIGYGTLNRMNQADRNGMGRFSEGGISVFKGPGTGTSDSIPTRLPVGSFIIRAKATKALGLNKGGQVQRFADGGGVYGEKISNLYDVRATLQEQAKTATGSESLIIAQKLKEVEKEMDALVTAYSKLADTIDQSTKDEESSRNDLDKANDALLKKLEKRLALAGNDEEEKKRIIEKARSGGYKDKSGNDILRSENLAISRAENALSDARSRKDIAKEKMEYRFGGQSPGFDAEARRRGDTPFPYPTPSGGTPSRPPAAPSDDDASSGSRPRPNKDSNDKSLFTFQQVLAGASATLNGLVQTIGTADNMFTNGISGILSSVTVLSSSFSVLEKITGKNISSFQDFANIQTDVALQLGKVGRDIGGQLGAKIGLVVGSMVGAFTQASAAFTLIANSMLSFSKKSFLLEEAKKSGDVEGARSLSSGVTAQNDIMTYGGYLVGALAALVVAVTATAGVIAAINAGTMLAAAPFLALGGIVAVVVGVLGGLSVGVLSVIGILDPLANALRDFFAWISTLPFAKKMGFKVDSTDKIASKDALVGSQAQTQIIADKKQREQTLSLDLFSKGKEDANKAFEPFAEEARANINQQKLFDENIAKSTAQSEKDKLESEKRKSFSDFEKKASPIIDQSFRNSAISGQSFDEAFKQLPQGLQDFLKSNDEYMQTARKSYDNLSKSVLDNIEKIKALNFGLDPVISKAKAASLSIDLFNSSLQVGGSSIADSVKIIEAGLTNAASNIDMGQFNSAVSQVGSVMSNLGASEAQIQQFTGTIKELNSIQSSFGTYLNEIKTDFAARGKTPEARDIVEAFKDKISKSLDARGVAPEVKERIMNSLKGLDNLSAEQRDKLVQDLKTNNLSGITDMFSGELAEELKKQLGPMMEPLMKANEALVKVINERVEAEKNLVSAQRQAIDLSLEGLQLQSKYGGAAVTPEIRRQAALESANVGRRRLGLEDVGGSNPNALRAGLNQVRFKFSELEQKRVKKGAMDPQGVEDEAIRTGLKDAQQDQVKLIRDLISAEEEQLKITKEKNKLEKDSLESLLAGDIDKFFKQQAAVGATAAIATGNAAAINQFGGQALGGAYQNLQRQKEAGVTELFGQRIAGTGGLLENSAMASLGARGIQNPRMAQILAGTTPEEEASNRRLREFGGLLGEAGAAGAEMAQMELARAEMNVERATINVKNSGGGDLLNNQPQNISRGGIVYASKGQLINFVPKGTDTVPAMLTPGEFVVNRGAVNRGDNLSFLRAINNGHYTANAQRLNSNNTSIPSIIKQLTNNPQAIQTQDTNTKLVQNEKNISNINFDVQKLSKQLGKFISGFDGFMENFSEQVGKLGNTEVSHKLGDVNLNINGGQFLQSMADGLKQQLMEDLGQKLQGIKVNNVGNIKFGRTSVL